MEPNLGHEHTNQQIRNWLDECLGTHSECTVPDGERPSQLPCLPTRVIDVGDQFDSEAKIFEPPSATYENYITLSYCWGTKRFTTTTLENINANKQRLDLSSLPQTFQDAIMTTKRLGFRYLWIDALCIIQNSNEDKANEISKMGDIYSNATLTIAVVSASRVGEGFLQTTPRTTVTLPYRCPDGVMGLVQVSTQKEVDLMQESLYTRAWCLQENLLSRRLLLYTDTEVIWQCQSIPMKRPDTNHVAYEHGDPNLDSSPFRRLPVNIVTPAKTPNMTENASVDEERYKVWRYLVESYTQRRLTVASDRLPALDGVAQKFRVAWSDEYFAGHWKRQFIPSLSWRRKWTHETQFLPPLSEYRAPSWSWASIDHPVEFDFRYDLGNARGLGAKLISCVFDIDSEADDAAIIEASMIRPTVITSLDYAHRGLIYLDDSPRKSSKQIVDTFENLSDEMLSSLWCMLLGEGQCGSGKMMKTVALLLESANDDNFRRIGLYECSVRGTSKLWMGKNNRRLVKII